jgi:hypothetical protein
LDGSPADSSVQFGIDGMEYSVDLSAKHENDLRTMLRPYLEVARKARPDGSKGRGRGRSVADKDRNAAIREWALSEGVELAQRGRIAGVVHHAYDAHDGDMLRESLGLELVEERPARRRRTSVEAKFSSAG